VQNTDKRAEPFESQLKFGFNIVSFIIKEAVLFAAAFFLVFNVYHTLDMRSMTETTGVITRHEPIVVASGIWGGREWVDVRVRMFVTHTVGGEQYETAWPTLAGHAGMVGQPVSFFYDPANPLRIRANEDRFSWVMQLVLGLAALVFFIGFMGIGCITESDSPRLPHIVIKVLEMVGASFVTWQWLSPATNAPVMFIGVLTALAGAAASTAANFKPELIPGLTPERKLLSQLVSIKNEGGQYVLQFRDNQGQTYSFFTPDAPNAAENSTCTLTLQDGNVLRFVPLASRKFD